MLGLFSLKIVGGENFKRQKKKKIEGEDKKIEGED